MDEPLKPWTELQDALDNAGLLLIDISSRSANPETRSRYSVSYLSNLRTGTYRRGPNARVIKECARVLGCSMEDLRPKGGRRLYRRPEYVAPETLAS